MILPGIPSQPRVYMLRNVWGFCCQKQILRPSYLQNGISYTGKMTSLYWIKAQVSRTWTCIYIPWHSVRCSYLSLPLIPPFGAKVPVWCTLVQTPKRCRHAYWVLCMQSLLSTRCRFKHWFGFPMDYVQYILTCQKLAYPYSCELGGRICYAIRVLSTKLVAHKVMHLKIQLETIHWHLDIYDRV